MWVSLTLIISVVAHGGSSKKSNNKVKDNRDGKIYPTVNVDGLLWMSGNLNHDMPGSSCYENSAENCKKYGRLYSAATLQDACPDGMRIPSVKEWESVENAAKSDALNLMTVSMEGSDKLGFHVSGSGIRDNDKTYMSLQRSAYFWASPESLYAVILRKGSLVVDYQRMGFGKEFQFSIRCVKDQNSVLDKINASSGGLLGEAVDASQKNVIDAILAGGGGSTSQNGRSARDVSRKDEAGSSDGGRAGWGTGYASKRQAKKAGDQLAAKSSNDANEWNEAVASTIAGSLKVRSRKWFPDSSEMYLDNRLIWAGGVGSSIDSAVVISGKNNQIVVLSQYMTGTAFESCDGRVGSSVLVLDDQRALRFANIATCGKLNVIQKAGVLRLKGSSDGKRNDESFVYNDGLIIAEAGSKARQSQITYEDLYNAEKSNSSTNGRVADMSEPIKSIHRSEDDVRSMFYQKSGVIGIYNEYLRMNPDLNGDISIRFKISPNGDIVSADIVRSSTHNKSMDEQIKDKARRLSFPECECEDLDIVITWKLEAVVDTRNSFVISKKLEKAFDGFLRSYGVLQTRDMNGVSIGYSITINSDGDVSSFSLDESSSYDDKLNQAIGDRIKSTSFGRCNCKPLSPTGHMVINR